MPEKVGGFGLVAKEGEAAESKRDEGGGVEEQQGRGRGGKRVGEGGKDERESGMKRERDRG